MLTSNLVALIFVPLLALYCLLLLLNRVNEEQPLRRLSKESLLPLIATLIRIGAAPAAGLLLGLLMSAFDGTCNTASSSRSRNSTSTR